MEHPPDHPFPLAGQQMKHGDATPKKDAPFDGILLRGDPPPKGPGPSKLQNWEYLYGPDITSFLPHSLIPLMPVEWS